MDDLRIAAAGIYKAKTEYPSTVMQWTPEMIDDCKRPIMDILADKFVELHETGRGI